MIRLRILSILATAALIYKSDSIELVANYKLWKSVSTQFAYDFSGNSRHGRFLSGFMVTDRGLATSLPSNSYTIRLMTYRFLSRDEYTISFWMLHFGGSSTMRLNLYTNAGYFYINYIFNPAVTYTTLQLIRNGGVISGQTKQISPKIQGWNLYTFRVYKNTPNPGILDINVYLNLNSVASDFIYSHDTNIDISIVDFHVSDSITASGIIGNEVWVHTGFSTISDLNYMISDPGTCGCEYTCPNTSTQTCLQSYSKSYNKLAQLCDSTCTDNSQSCDSAPTSCILQSKTECQYGLYDRESLECILNCPNGSCVCPGLPSTPVATLLSCSCKVGYNKILDDSQSCISNRCLEYHRVGYKYVCDTTESGYSLDNTGECCICASGFTQVQSSPMICVNTSICIGHTISGGDYRCSSCTVGYTKDSKAKCNLCSSGYVNVLANPYTCAWKIENCIEYIYIGTVWECKTCYQGYAVDSEGKCYLCSSGYLNVLANPYTCTSKIENCIEYIYIDTVWKCKTCMEGYFLFQLYMDDIICAQVINSCADYKLEDMTPVCNTCQDGFYLSESKIKCLILNCLAYRLDEDKYHCSQCSIGYQIDSDGKCNKCSVNYEELSGYPFTCAPKIENCSSYHSSDKGYVCQICQIGYKLGSSGLCDECEDGFVLIDSETVECKIEVLNCLDYEIFGEILRCMTCKEGYALDSNYECTICDGKNMQHPQDSSICIRKVPHCLEYELLKDTMVCKECEPEYNLDDNLECKTCPRGYIYSNDSISECLLEPENTNQDSDSAFSDENEEEAIPEVQSQRGEIVESSNTIATIITSVSTGVSSMISNCPNTLILYLNTIKILSLIQYLNINLPFEIRKQQSSISQHLDKINILSYVKIEDKDMIETSKSYMNDESSFVAGTIYQFIILIAILIINLLIYCISRCAKGKIKVLGNKMLRYFKYNIYIQLYMITYLDTIYIAIYRLMHVISI